MGNDIFIWIDENKKYKFDVNKAIDKAKEDAEAKEKVRRFIEEAIEWIETINSFFEDVENLLNRGFLASVAEDRRSDEEATSQDVQRFKTMKEENKESSDALKNLLGQF